MKTKILSTLAGLATALFLTAGGPAGTQATQAQGLVEYALILKLTEIEVVAEWWNVGSALDCFFDIVHDGLVDAVGGHEDYKGPNKAQCKSSLPGAVGCPNSCKTCNCVTSSADQEAMNPVIDTNTPPGN